MSEGAVGAIQSMTSAITGLGNAAAGALPMLGAVNRAVGETRREVEATKRALEDLNRTAGMTGGTPDPNSIGATRGGAPGTSGVTGGTPGPGGLGNALEALRR